MRRRLQASLDQLLQELGSRQVSTRASALEALSGFKSPRASIAVIKSVCDRSPMVRVTAAECLGRMKIRGQGAAFALIKVLSDRFREVRMRSAESLGVLLSGTRKSPRPLVHMLKDTDELVRVETAEALGAIGDPTILPFLILALGDPSPLVRSYVAGAIGAVGAKKALPILEARLLRERSNTAKVGLYHALYMLGKDMTIDLQRLSKSTDYRVRCAVANTLGTIASSSNAQGVRRFLEKWLKEEKTIAVKSTLRSNLRGIANGVPSACPAEGPDPRTETRRNRNFQC